MFFSNTGPGKVDDIEGVSDNTTESVLYVKWNEPQHRYDFFQVHAECNGPNTNSTTTNYTLNDTNNTYTEVAGLEPGTFCSITVVTILINEGTEEQLDGSPAIKKIKISTKEKGIEILSIEKQVSRLLVKVLWTIHSTTLQIKITPVEKKTLSLTT